MELAHINYTYSHTLDESSNNGPYLIGSWAGGGIAQTQINPGSLRTNNYGNADYDVRHLFTADYVVTAPTHFENKLLKGALGGWQWSGKSYAHSGLPYSVYDANTGGDLLNGGIALADVISAGTSNPCGSGAAYTKGRFARDPGRNSGRQVGETCDSRFPRQTTRVSNEGCSTDCHTP